jgi:hypothetical protein
VTALDEFDDITTAPDEIEERALPGQRIRVTLEGQDPYVVRITNRERVRWDMTAPRQGWGKAEDVPFLAQTFMAWSASRRENLTALKFEQFRDVVDDLEGLKAEVSDTARPTR